MSEKRKKQLGLLGKGMLILAAFITLGFVTHSHNNRVCEEIVINVDVSNNMHFLSKEDVLKVLVNRGVQAQGQIVRDIDLAAVEATILEIPAVEKAAVYTTVGGKLQIDVVQRTPVVRIFNANGSSFYLDVNGVPMPLSMNYTARTLPVTGMLNEQRINSVEEIALNDSLSDASMLDDIHALAMYIEQDAFLKAQVVQVDVNKNKDFVLVPRVGGQDIIFGRTDDLEARFNKLKLFYEKGLRKSDRRKYDRIDLRFDGQIVCTKKRI